MKVAQTYADLLASLWRMQSTEQSLATHQKLREQVQRRVDLGMQSDADLRLAETRLDSVKSDLSATRARVEKLCGSLKTTYWPIHPLW
jgi:outer membrane protein TolC